LLFRSTPLSIGLGCVLVALAMLWASAAIQAAGAQVKLVPPSQIKHVDETFDVDILVAGASNLAAYEVEIAYDEDVLEFASFTDQGFLGGSGRHSICPPPAIHDQSVQVGCATTGALDAPGVDGDAKLGTIRFKARSPGTSPLVYKKVELADPSADDCCGELSLGEGVVRVLGSGEDDPQSLPATPTLNPTALTPTPIPQGLLDEAGERNVLPDAPSGTGSSGSASSGSSSGGIGSSAGRTGTINGAGSGATDEQGFPIAGTGPSETGPSDFMRTAAVLLTLSGVALTSIGVAQRRKRGR